MLIKKKLVYLSIIKNKTMKIKKATIYKDPISSEVVIEFNNKKDFYTYCKEHNTYADAISINGISFYGWDEIDLFFQCRSMDEFFDLTD